MDTLARRLIDLEKVYKEYYRELKEDFESSNNNRADEVLLMEARTKMDLLNKAVQGDKIAIKEILPLLSTTTVH